MIVFFFFFNQKRAYEIEYGLVGSEMCIRDSDGTTSVAPSSRWPQRGQNRPPTKAGAPQRAQLSLCLLYTSDAADERSSVDLGGRRIINKNTTRHDMEPGALI